MRPSKVNRIGTAIWDPGAILQRGDNYDEYLANWQVRAVRRVISERLDELTLHDDTGDPRDEAYMDALADVRTTLLGDEPA